MAGLDAPALLQPQLDGSLASLATHPLPLPCREGSKETRIDIVDTGRHPPTMAKARVSERKMTWGAPESGAAETKGSINLRINARTRDLIDRAAAIKGKTRTDFMIESAVAEATDVVLDQSLVLVTPEHYDAFVRILDNPPAPGPKLRALLQRKAPWDA